jgi:hypothetical protein
MTFYVDKRLALGPIRFGVSTRQDEQSIDGDVALSTGPTGEFVHRRQEGSFFGGHDRFDKPTLPQTRTIANIPFWESLKPDGTPRSWGFLALMLVGAIFVLLGFAVVARKGPQGWVEIFLGLVMIAVPIGMTTQRRKQIREQEERERVEREALEKRNRETLAAYTAALEHVRAQRDDAALAQLAREREALTLPYEIWGAAARRTALLIGFDELARRGPAAASEIAQLMDRISRAAGLTPQDETGVKLDFYRTILWHLLADDRLGEAQQQQLLTIRNGLGISDRDIPAEWRTADEFRRLRGMTSHDLRRAQCSTRLAFKEHCIYEAPTDQGTLHVTNKRVLVDGAKRFELPLAHVFEISVDADANVVAVKTNNPRKPLHLRVEEPIYAAAMLDLASQIDERPRGFA